MTDVNLSKVKKSYDKTEVVWIILSAIVDFP